MFAPLSACAPQTLPFSMTATGTSPSFSMSFGSSASRSSSLFAQARPAGPPPTIATPTSIRSSSGSVGCVIRSCSSKGGGNSFGSTAAPDAIVTSAALLGLNGLGQLRQDLVEVTDDTEVGELEDRSIRVLVDRKDVLRVLHPDLVLDRAGDAR